MVGRKMIIIRRLAQARAKLRQLAGHLVWRIKGGAPPKVIKVRLLRRLAKEYGLRLFVETGTYHGTTLAALQAEFDRLYSIELGEELFQEARKRFREEPHIELINGDSAVELPRLLARLDEPALVWLDGHYSGGSTAKGKKETPVLEEVMALTRSSQKHVIVIDDLHCFGSLPDYPALEDFRQLLRRCWPTAQLREEADMILILPKRVC